MFRMCGKLVQGVFVLGAAILLIVYSIACFYVDKYMEAKTFEREFHTPNADIKRPPKNVTILTKEVGSNVERGKEMKEHLDGEEVTKMSDRNKQIDEGKNTTRKPESVANDVNKDEPPSLEPEENTVHDGDRNAEKESVPDKRKGNDVPVDKHGCREWFEDSFEDNLNHISQYPGGVAERFMHTIVGNLTKPRELPTHFPVIATAANSAYFLISQGLLMSVYEKLVPRYNSTLKVVYYDIGLQDRQRKQLIHYCDICEVRKFPFEDLPEHVRKLKTYTWKPVIVKKLLLEFGWVWWMDSSVRLLTNDLDTALKYSQDNSMLYFTNPVSLAVALQTDRRTMQYFNEDSCKFRHFGEVEANFVLFHSDNVTNIVVDKWGSCALSQACMAPKGTEHKLHCQRNDTRDGRCHRFDQSVLSILLRRLYHERNYYPLVSELSQIYQLKRGVGVEFFRELSDKNRKTDI